MQRTALVLGAGGFIGSHMVRRLKAEGLHVTGADLKHPEFSATSADRFHLADLRDPQTMAGLFEHRYDEVYQFAADMGGAHYIFSGAHDAAILHNNELINLNIGRAAAEGEVGRLFFASSACVYPRANQQHPDRVNCAEHTALPADPDSDYGWEKLTAEKLYRSHSRNNGLVVRIGRFHNVFGPEGCWTGGREKVVAALCRKVAMATDGTLEITGDGEQWRSFLHVDEAIEGTLRLMRSEVEEPLNIGSDEMVSTSMLADMIMDVAGVSLAKIYVPGPVGVRARNSDNRLIAERLNWRPTARLRDGLAPTYSWIAAAAAATAGVRIAAE
jgi:GDP-D-mannose 3',5'-epimerase